MKQNLPMRRPAASLYSISSLAEPSHYQRGAAIVFITSVPPPSPLHFLPIPLRRFSSPKSKNCEYVEKQNCEIHCRIFNVLKSVERNQQNCELLFFSNGMRSSCLT